MRTPESDFSLPATPPDKHAQLADAMMRVA
jgi:hypothetical protein